MASNNLGAPRIANNQTSGQHRTANDGLNALDGAMTDSATVLVGDTNAATVSSTTVAGYFRFVVTAASPAPSGAVAITLNSSTERGLMLWRNSLSYQATVSKSGQTAPAVVIPPGGAALIDFDGSDARLVNYQQPFFMTVAASDESTALTTGAAKVTFRMPARVWLTEVRASLVTAQTSGSVVTVDVNEGGVSILSTVVTLDNGEKTTLTAATPAVISDAAIADDAEITIDVDQIGDGTATGLKLTFIGIRY